MVILEIESPGGDTVSVDAFKGRVDIFTFNHLAGDYSGAQINPAIARDVATALLEAADKAERME